MTSQYLLDTLTPVVVYTFLPHIENSNIPMVLDMGSDIQVMLALRCSSRQVVMADEQFDGTHLLSQLLGTRRRHTHQPGPTLAQRVIEPLARIGCTP